MSCLTFFRCLLTHLVKVFFWIASRSSVKERRKARLLPWLWMGLSCHHRKRRTSRLLDHIGVSLDCGIIFRGHFRLIWTQIQALFRTFSCMLTRRTEGMPPKQLLSYLFLSHRDRVHVHAIITSVQMGLWRGCGSVVICSLVYSICAKGGFYTLILNV